MATTVKTWDQYIKDATDRLTPDYNAQQTAADTAYNSNLTDLNNRVGSTNATYDAQVEDIGRNTTLTQNNYNSGVASRGMSRSSVADTGLAGIANTGTRLTNTANQNRTNDLNSIDALKTTLLSNYNASKTALEGKKQSDILSTADQLQKYDQQQYNLEQQAIKDEAFRQAQLAIQRQANAAAASQAEAARQASENGALTDQIDKDYSTYLNLGQRMQDKTTKTKVYDETGSSYMDTPTYTNDDMYNWINGLRFSSNPSIDAQYKYKLATALGVKRPANLSVNPSYGQGNAPYSVYSGGR